MIDINENIDNNRNIINNTAINEWHEWKPSWTGKFKTPHDIQEKHSPTEVIQVKTPNNSKPQKAIKRIVDNRLWSALTSSQQHASIEINNAFEMMSKGMGYASSNWQKIPGCRSPSNITEARLRMINFYLEWVKKCTEKKLSHSMVVDILCFGFSCRMIDHDRRLRKGGTKKNLMSALTLYCQLHGWE